MSSSSPLDSSPEASPPLRNNNTDEARNEDDRSRRNNNESPAAPETQRRRPVMDLNNLLSRDSSDDDSDNEDGDPGSSSNRNSNGHNTNDDTVIPPTPVTARRNNHHGNDSSDDDADDNPNQNDSDRLPETPLTPLSPNDDDVNNDPERRRPNRVLEDDDDDDNDNANANEAAEQDQDADMLNNSNDDVAPEQEQQAVIRGTNVHVPTAAAAFSEFLKTFVSLAHASRQQQQGNNSDSDDDDSIMSDEENNRNDSPLYSSQLRALLDPNSPNTNTSTVVVVELHQGGPVSLNLDARHLYFHNPACQKLYHQLTSYPMELIPLFDICCQRALEEMIAENDNNENNITTVAPQIQVRPFNLRSVRPLRTLDPIHMESLVGVQGMIVRTSTILPDLKIAHFQCTLCGHDQQVAIDRGRIAEPTGKCPSCNAKAQLSYQLIHNRCTFHDKQWVRLQETPDQVPAGQAPASVLLFAFDDMCDAVVPGDRVEVTAVLRAQPVRTHPKLTKLRTLHKTYLDVVHYRKITGMNNATNGVDENDQQQEKAGGRGDNDTHNNTNKWSPQRVAELQALSRQPDIYSQLVQSLAPSIWELDNVKKGVLCMLFGGNTGQPKSNIRDGDSNGDDDDAWLDQDDNDDNDNGENTSNKKQKHSHKRGDVNILLCGDPGTSKSQLLSYVHKMSHRGVYTSGKGSSAVGLTASVVRDPETRDLVLESGALVLSDLGICCIDEFDKMSDTTRSVLHEAMEQQTVSIAKAGIIATLHARTSVLASANPIESRYNPNRSVVDNIQLPPTLLSRFDLIYLILDTPQVEQDRRLAQHLVGLYYETPNVIQPPIDQDLLRDYIQYARENIHPQLSDEAANQLLESYLEMRGNGVASRTITATPRQLESLIRLTEALAKMRYSQTATRADAQEAVRLMRVATCSAATDPRTGRIDMDLINTGRGSEARERDEQMHMAVQEILQSKKGQRLTVRDLIQTIQEVTGHEAEHSAVTEALRVMEAEGVIQYNERAQSVFVRAGIAR